jgi:diguanylate cyclase (GGDEF)-like protein
MPTLHRCPSQAADLPAATPTSADLRLLPQTTRALYGNGSAGIAATLAVVLATVALCWQSVPPAALLTWFAAMLALGVWRGVLIWRYHGAAPDDDALLPWRRGFLASVAGTGCVLGAGWWVLAPHLDNQQQLLLMLALAGMAIGAVPVLSASLLAYCSYAALICAPAIAWMFAQGDARHLFMGTLGTCLLLLVIGTARAFHRNLLHTLRLSDSNRLLRWQQQRLRDFARLGADLFWECDEEGRFTYLSEGYEDLTGTPASAMIGTPVNATGLPRFLPATDGDGAPPAPFEGHTLNWTGPGGHRHVLRSSAVRVEPAGQSAGGLRGTVCDITREHELAAKLSHQASHDPLTDLVNRREFEQRLTGLLQRPEHERHTHALCYLDLDQFKQVNDSCGHTAGDALLRQLAGVLKRRLRSRDTLARLGGDEFGVLLEQCDAEDALAVAEGIRGAVEGIRFQWRGQVFQLTVSIGVVTMDESWFSAADAMMAADSACYASKDSGRNRVHLYSGEDTARSSRHGEMQWATRVTRALEDEGLTLVALPIVALDAAASLQTPDPLRHFEVLLRLRGDDHALIAPAAFLPAAERYGLAPRLDAWVVDTTMDWLSQHRRRVQTCSVNLSSNAVADEAFLQRLLERLEGSVGLGERLCFEITETTAMISLEQTRRFMEALRPLGCRFALDDFGAGLSSFGYLKNLPVDYLKIDGAFVRGMLDDEVDRTMVRSIQEVARILGKQTIAECVEDESMLAPLRQLGINHAQGFALARPRVLDESASPISAQIIHLHR